MGKKPRYSIKKYILIIAFSSTVGVVITVLIGGFLGFPNQGLLAVVLLSYPFVILACLTGFHKGLVKYYGFDKVDINNKENQKT